MKKEICILLLFGILVNLVSAQTSEAKSKAFYFSAQDAYMANNYDESLALLDKSVEAGGASNGYIEALKAKCHVGKKDWKKAKQTLEICYAHDPGDDVLKDLSSIISLVDTEYEKAITQAQDRLMAEQLAELERIDQQEARLLAEIKAEENRIAMAKAHYQEASAFLEAFKTLKEGYPYLINMNTISSLDSEKSIFIFYGDKYLIYTIPNIGYVKSMFKDDLVFDPTMGMKSIQRHIKHKNSVGGKSEDHFKRSPQYNNIFYGKKGMAWIGEQYTKFDDELYYYYIYMRSNAQDAAQVDFFCDTDLELDEAIGNYLNPYVETGKIIKEVNYDFIGQEGLKAEYEANGFSHSDKSDRPMEKVSAIRKTLNMLFAKKKATFVMVDDKAKDMDIDQKYLYFEEQDVSMLYGFISYQGFQENALDDLMTNIKGINNDYKMSRESFDRIYESLDQTFGSSKIVSYTSPEYREPFEDIIKLYGYFDEINLNH